MDGFGQGRHVGHAAAEAGQGAFHAFGVGVAGLDLLPDVGEVAAGPVGLVEVGGVRVEEAFDARERLGGLPRGPRVDLLVRVTLSPVAICPETLALPPTLMPRSPC